MPIANCIVSPAHQQCLGNIIEAWAEESGKPIEHMTVNITNSNQQFGNEYAVMANLLLPSMWSSSEVSSLQIGLAKALAKNFKVSIKQIHVVTSIINSGMVVEGGQELTW